MKVIDRSPKTEEGTPVSKLTGRIRKIMEFGLSWESDVEAQEVILTQLGKTLNNKYFLLRNIQFEGLEIPIPLVLVGPPGIYVMYTSALKGVYRAKSETWATMNGRTRKFEPARPNLITRLLLMSRAVETFLEKRGVRVFEMQSVLLFTNPGTHVDAIRPAVRVVLMDGLERFIAGLAQTRTFLNGEEVQKIVDALLQPTVSPAMEMESTEDGLTPGQLRTSLGVASAVPTNLSRNYVSFTRRFNLSPRQWIFLGVMVFLEVGVLIAFIVYVLLTS